MPFKTDVSSKFRVSFGIRTQELFITKQRWNHYRKGSVNVKGDAKPCSCWKYNIDIDGSHFCSKAHTRHREKDRWLSNPWGRGVETFYFRQFFAKTAWKWRHFGPEWGARSSPPPRSATASPRIKWKVHETDTYNQSSMRIPMPTSVITKPHRNVQNIVNNRRFTLHK